MALLKRPMLDRFLDRLAVDSDGCWSLGLAPSPDGYTYMGRGGRSEGKALMHRWAYEQWVGPIPPGLDLDHLCRHRWCVNPDHVEPVTRRENLMRGDTLSASRAAQTYCKCGHLLPPYEPGESRQCRPCANELRRIRRQTCRS